MLGFEDSAQPTRKRSRQKSHLLPAATKLLWRKKRLGDFFPMNQIGSRGATYEEEAAVAFHRAIISGVTFRFAAATGCSTLGAVLRG
jgi:hypothetical protein